MGFKLLNYVTDQGLTLSEAYLKIHGLDINEESIYDQDTETYIIKKIASLKIKIFKDYQARTDSKEQLVSYDKYHSSTKYSFEVNCVSSDNYHKQAYDYLKTLTEFSNYEDLI